MIIVKSAQEALTHVESKQNVFIHSGVSIPQASIRELIKRAPELKNVNLYQIHTEGDGEYLNDKYRSSFNPYFFFVGDNARKNCANYGCNYIPIFLSEIPSLFYNKIIDLDVALVQVSPPDEHGMMSLGPSVDITIAAVRSAKKVIAQINPNFPRTFGDAQINEDFIDIAYIEESPLLEVFGHEVTEEEMLIGKNIASLIEDGATLQMGIGSIPNAVLKCLGNHKDLGIHTEMFSDGVIELAMRGIINGRLKKKHPYKIVTGFAMGTERLYQFIDNNPGILFLDSAYVNNPHIIAQNPKVTAINSAIEVDLSGQVCADSIGPRIYSGVGGQMDFIRAAGISEGGKPIIALPSKTKKGESKIVFQLKPGAGVVTTRAHVHYIATENGVAYLHGKSLKERAKELIKIAAPEHRESLEREAHKLFF